MSNTFTPMLRLPLGHANDTPILSVVYRSHKAEFQKPSSMDVDATRALMQSYACPPGSLLVFTESLLHATAEWIHPTRDRIAIFTHYCSLHSVHHRLLLPHEAIVTMPKLRQSLFRGIWEGDWGGLDGQKVGERSNVYYSETNSAADSIVHLAPKL